MSDNLQQQASMEAGFAVVREHYLSEFMQNKQRADISGTGSFSEDGTLRLSLKNKQTGGTENLVVSGSATVETPGPIGSRIDKFLDRNTTLPPSEFAMKGDYTVVNTSTGQVQNVKLDGRVHSKTGELLPSGLTITDASGKVIASTAPARSQEVRDPKEKTALLDSNNQPLRFAAAVDASSWNCARERNPEKTECSYLRPGLQAGSSLSINESRRNNAYDMRSVVRFQAAEFKSPSGQPFGVPVAIVEQYARLQNTGDMVARISNFSVTVRKPEQLAK